MSTRKPVDKKTKRETSKDDNLVTKKPEEKQKKSIYSVSTPRSFVQKSSAADIYSKKNNVQSVKTPKKPSNSRNNAPINKDSLKSSPSTATQISSRSHRLNKSINETKTTAPYAEKAIVTATSKNTGVIKKLPLTNVTVNSPIAKRKLNVETVSKEVKNEEKSKKPLLLQRKRTKTRTLDEGEIKILTPNVVDKNLDMVNMTKKLSAQPKAFYIDLDEGKTKTQQKPTERSTDEEFSYEDDFESYESDFESYQSESQSEHSNTLEDDNVGQNNDENDSSYSNNVQIENDEEGQNKEERMLDSGNFELRDPRTVGKSQPMDFILEGAEDLDKKPSLTDEGFQEMSSSSGVYSIKTLHIDVLERPLFVDFTKTRESRRKRKVFERLKQRAKDILNMVTLHEMSYDLFEMKPIPYDLYMATFGRFNYTQTAVQTFDDGVNEEMQTDEIFMDDKWTQNPVEFSKNNFNVITNKRRKDSVENFAFLDSDIHDTDNKTADDNYINNHLRIYLEQKNGVGSNRMLPYENYKSKLKNDCYDIKKLRKFLKKHESRISSILCTNSGNTMSNLIKTSKFPFSNELLTISTRDVSEKLLFLKNSRIIGAIFSETKSNLLITVHDRLSSGFVVKKCVLCLWDLNMTVLEPLKTLVATDNVKIGRFRGSTDGFLVGALCDGTIHLWDLTEEATWCSDVADDEKTTKMVEIDPRIDSENRDKDNNYDMKNQLHTLQACSYTSSAMNISKNESVDSIVGLELMGECNENLDCGRKILAQLCALQSIGILTIWSIIQDKTKNSQHDIGKAFWSKLKLERNQTIKLLEHIDVPIHDSESENSNFNLNSAKKRMLRKRNERNINRISRPKSAIAKCQDDTSSVANRKNLVENLYLWENSVVCNHLKIMNLNNVENYLVAKNSGEVLCCRRNIGTVKVKTFSVASPVTSITCIETSPHKLPYFLAATDCGTVNLCSLVDYRVLLTLDSRNGPSSADRCLADHKGRYLGSITVHTDTEHLINTKLPITTLSWLHPNPFCIAATFDTHTAVWQLTHSDIRAACVTDGVSCTTSDRTMALLTKEYDLQVYKLTESKENCLELFEKYVLLL